MTLFGEVDMEHYHIGEGRAGLLEKLLNVRHCLPELLVDSVTEDSGTRVSAHLPADCEDISTSDSLRMWTYRRQSTLARDNNRLHLDPFLSVMLACRRLDSVRQTDGAPAHDRRMRRHSLWDLAQPAPEGDGGPHRHILGRVEPGDLSLTA
jgi:hypothetical protein